MYDYVINRVKYKLETIPPLRISLGTELFFSKKTNRFRSICENNNDLIGDWLKTNDKNDQEYINYDFSKFENGSDLSLDVGKYFYPIYLKYVVINHFLANGFLVEVNPRIYDLCVYERISQFNGDWDIYRKIIFQNKSYSNELVFTISSNGTFICKPTLMSHSTPNYGVTQQGIIKPISQLISPSRVIANKKLRDEFNLSLPLKQLSYKRLYDDLTNFYISNIRIIDDDHLSFNSFGLSNVNTNDIQKVNPSGNKMLFKNSEKDVNAYTGMREFGAFQNAPKALENKFIFIYENRDDANKLYQYLRNGLRHFPGLDRYVGIPVTLERDLSCKYTNINSLPIEFDEFLQMKLNNNYYENLFAFVIGPFKKNESDEHESALYYQIKEKLLAKGIPSQFVSYKSIRNDSTFHFYLPNIAIAVLAKLGGIPWRLDNKNYSELVIGFNQVNINKDSYVGSAVFFDNEGHLNSVKTFPKSESSKTIINHLRDSINNYFTEKNEHPKRIIIHYYKPQSNQEQKELEDLLHNELNLEIPYAIVEVNDSKTQTEVCFDKNLDFGMPESGISIRISRNEYLLFNNLRYEKNPLRAVKEEYPIKVKIHYADQREFTHNELISQIYEFSRLYWKSIKQQSQPVTTEYAKLVAEFSAHFNGDIPNNTISTKTPWFI